MRTLLSQVVKAQLPQKSFRCLKGLPLILQVIQPEKLLKHLFGCFKGKEVQPVALDDAIQGHKRPGAGLKHKLGPIKNTEHIVYRGHSFQPKLVGCISERQSM